MVLTYLSLSNAAAVTGDIRALTNQTALTRMFLPSTNIYGDIAALRDTTGLTSLSIYNTKVTCWCHTSSDSPDRQTVQKDRQTDRRTDR